jgi:hypothetical protein
MASTITAVSAGQAIMTDKCISEVLAGNLVTSNTFKLVLLNLSLGALTLSQTATTFWSDLSDAETVGNAGYTKGTGITFTGANQPAISSHMGALDFAGVSLDNADFTTDAYAIVRWVSTTANSPVLALGKWDATKTPSGTGTANFTATVVNPLKFTAGAAA